MAHISDSILWLSLSRYRRLVVGSMIAYERGMSDAILSLAILASAALIWGGVRLIRDAMQDEARWTPVVERNARGRTP